MGGGGLGGERGKGAMAAGVCASVYVCGGGGFAVLCVEQRSPTLAEWALSSGFLWQTKILSPAVGVYGNRMRTISTHLAVIMSKNTLQLTPSACIFTLIFFFNKNNTILHLHIHE